FPLAQAGFSGPDLRALVDAGRLGEGSGALEFARRAHAVGGLEGAPLAALDVALGAVLGAGAGEGGWAARPAWPWRLEGLALLIGAALALGAFLRRLLLPWIGREAAGAAGRAACLLFPLAPIHAAVLCRLSARGALWALLLGLLAGALLLRGRQERKPALSIQAGALALLASAASDLALALPFVLAGAEFVSARRWRRERERWRTTSITLFAFTLCVALPQALARALGGGDLVGDTRMALVDTPSGLAGELARELERLGVLLVPVPVEVLGIAGLVLGVGALLLALHPALQALRAAPRLWGWLALAWFAVLALTEALASPRTVRLDELGAADSLLAATAATCAGLAVCATALSGARRTAVPLVLALVWCLLAHAGARAWRDATWELARLGEALEDARETLGREAGLVVIEPRARAAGVDALDGTPAVLCDPAVTGRASDPRPPRVRGANTAAFLALAREDEFDTLRREGALVSAPRAALDLDGSGRLALALTPPAPSGRVRSWRDQGRSPSSLDLDTAHERALRVRAQHDADVEHAPLVHWRGPLGGGPLAEGSARGVWSLRPPHTEEPIAEFDLSASLAWVLAGRAQQLYPREGWGSIVEARLLERLAGAVLELAPRVDGGAWSFAPPAGGWPGDPEGRLEWRVGLLDLTTWSHVELPVEVDGAGHLHV
ncbi:MAG TPA: hypothetical protein VMT18_02450, partial [Planctomycetota bacterium]|nr:hypothetical protein [Planctomycetota bacterium]